MGAGYLWLKACDAHQAAAVMATPASAPVVALFIAAVTVNTAAPITARNAQSWGLIARRERPQFQRNKYRSAIALHAAIDSR